MNTVRTVIELTETQLKVFQGVRAAGGFVLHHADVVDMVGASENAVAGMLKLKESSRSRADVVLVVPREAAIVRVLTLPSKDLAELRQMANLQIARHIPYSQEDVVVDVIPVLPLPDGSTRVMLVALPKAKAVYFLRVLTYAGLKPGRITLSSMGIVRWCRNHAALGDEVLMLVDVDAHKSEICLCSGQKVYALRSVAWGAADGRAGHFEELIRQLKLTAMQHHKEKIFRDIERVLVLSSLEEDNGLCARITQELGLPSDFKCVLKHVAPKKGLRWPGTVIDAGSSVTAGLGFLLVGEGVDVDLMPLEYKQQKAGERRKSEVVRLGFLLVTALLSVGLVLGMGLVRDSWDLNALEKQVSDLKPAASKVESREKQIRELDALIRGRVVFARLADALERLLPEKVVLRGLTISDGKTLTIQGVTPVSADIDALQKGMAAEGFFENITLNYVNKRPQDRGEYNFFKITCQINTGE